MWPFYQYDPDDEASVQTVLIDNTEKPYVDPRYRTRSLIEGELVNIMEEAWEWDLELRVSIFHVLQRLYRLRDVARAAGEDV